MKRMSLLVLSVVLTVSAFSGCSLRPKSVEDSVATRQITSQLQEIQPTPTDINFSLERYNLIRRAYWVNGQREKANSVPCGVPKPVGYILLLTNNGCIVGEFCVDGKVSSLNSYLTPDSMYYEYSAGQYSTINTWVADVDGSYGENDDGIFFFTPDGNYVEWSGTYLYSDIPFDVDDSVVSYID